MKEIVFKVSLSRKAKLGKKRKFLNKRTLKSNPSEIPILIIDNGYIETLLHKKSISKQSIYYNNINKNTIEVFCSLLLEKLLSTTLPKGILVVNNSSTSVINKLLVSFWEETNSNIVNSSITDFIYSIKIQHLIETPCTIFTNSISCWGLSNLYANLSFIGIDTNNRLILYNNKTGLDFFCKLIQTNKIINKLGLDDIKYLNLQYLYIMLLYISFIHQKYPKQFSFDADYFKDIPKYSDKTFARSLGFGYSLVSEAHSFLSYAFLTKPEYMDYFLLGSHGDYSSHFNRLVKLLPNDILILNTFKRYYDNNYRPQSTKYTKEKLKTTLPSPITEYSTSLKLLSYLITSSTPTISSFSEQKKLYRLCCKIFNRYSELPHNLYSSLSKKYQKCFEVPSKYADNSIMSYISNLLLGS